MKRRCIVSISVAVLLFMIKTVPATVWYVHPDSALNSIQAGIDSCVNGDTVLVGPGTYTENINFNGMAITVQSEYGADTTIIDGGSPTNPDSGSVVTCASGEDITSVLCGFKIINGSGTYVPAFGFLGGGIYCNNSAPTIKENVIIDNGSSKILAGGGVECDENSSPIIIDNVIKHNEAEFGGGVECYYASPTIHNNTIDSNMADWGGGISYSYGGPSDIVDNHIRWNTADSIGGGILCDNNSINIIGNVISHNTAERYGGGIRCWLSSAIIKHNIITDNTASIGYGGGGIRCQQSATPSIDSCVIANNNGDGIYCWTAADPEIHYCNITGNVGYGVVNTYSYLTIDAEFNWWGDPSGPGGVGPGSGDSVSDYVDFDPWLQDSVQGIGIQELRITKTCILNLHVAPNPFCYRTVIQYSITNSQFVAQDPTIRIYDATGRL
ncbi:MAG: right-handed parallel beta-helix repeat-containing protein, partial [candidate division WOR-3 bacterium]